MAKPRYARIITMEAKRGKGDEFVEKFREGVAWTAVDLEGMSRLYLFRPVGKKDEFVVISLWDDEQAAESYARSPRNRRYGEELAGVQEGKERVEKFNVELHVVGGRSEAR